MSVLEATQHTPERVHALMRLLSRTGGDIGRSDIADLMLPHESQERGNSSDVAQLLTASSSLGLITSTSNDIRNALPAPDDFGSFSDLCYDRFLMAAPPDANSIVLDALAIAAHHINRDGSPDWFIETDRATFMSLVEAALKGARAEATVFNESRPASWRRWLIALGCSIKLDARNDYIDVTSRLEREFRRDQSLPTATAIAARDAMRWARERLPFLPGGARSISLLLEPISDSKADVLLSAALRNLHDEGKIELIVHGDSSAAVNLSGQIPHRIGSFTALQILPEVLQRGIP